MICLSVNKLTAAYGADVLFSDASFALQEQDHVGIIGVNGCGKSTLLRLLLGEIEPSEGSVFISKDKTVGILRQDCALSLSDVESCGEDVSAIEVMYRSFDELCRMERRLSALSEVLSQRSYEDGRSEESYAAEYTALNEQFIRMGGMEFRGRCVSTLMRMGFDEDSLYRPFSSLSGGQRTRLAISRELCREPDILLLDEPTNHLDTETLTWLEGYLASYKNCFLVISHDRYFLDRVTNKTLCMENGRVSLYTGGYTQSAEQRRIDREIAERHYQNQQREIARQEAYIAQQRAWNRERNIIAAESRQKMLDKMERLEKPKEAPRGIHMRFATALTSGNEVLNVRNLSFGYPQSRLLIEDMSVSVRRGDRYFIVGPNGCGKSTLIKLIIGRLAPVGGYAEFGYNVQVGYYDQENQNLTDGNTVLDELWNAYPRLTENKVRSTLAMFRFTGDDVFKSVHMLSGGERARLTLAKLILSEVNLLVLDEPTNHLDIDSREALEEALESFDGTVLTVSHDRYLIDKLATKILDMTPSADRRYTELAVLHKGQAYGELCIDRERREQPGQNASPVGKPQEASTQKEQYLRNKQNAAEQRKEKARRARLEKEMQALEAELEQAEKELCGSAATDYVRASELDTRIREIEDRLLEIYEELEA